MADKMIVMTHLDPWLSIRALSAYSGLSQRTLKRRLADPVHPIPAMRTEGRVLVRASAFDRWLKEETRRYHEWSDAETKATVDGLLAEVRRANSCQNPKSGRPYLESVEFWRNCQAASQFASLKKNPLPR